MSNTGQANGPPSAGMNSQPSQSATPLSQQNLNQIVSLPDLLILQHTWVLLP